jgi:cytidylate kinase
LRPAVTISREAGAGGVSIGSRVVELLRAEQKRDECPWAVFDRNLVERVLADHELPTRIKEFMPEDTTAELKTTFEELLGLHPPSWTLFEHTTDTILRLAQAGNVVIVGRGSNIITSRLRHVLHVRMVAPLEKRIAHVAEHYQLGYDEAVAFVRKTDKSRRRYVSRYFNADISNPLAYHLTINTGLASHDSIARIIVHAVRNLELCL